MSFHLYHQGALASEMKSHIHSESWCIMGNYQTSRYVQSRTEVYAAKLLFQQSPLCTVTTRWLPQWRCSHLWCFVACQEIHRRPSHPVVHQMSLHPDYHQWATGGPPDVATSSGPPDVTLAVGTRMLACGCNADADIKWPTGCTHPVVHPMCTHAVVRRMRTSTGHEYVRCWS